MGKKYKYGLVLSGGGTRGFAHLGVIAALYDLGIKPDVITGASAGSIVGAFIAAGKTPKEILSIFKRGSVFQFTKIHLPIDGLVKLSGLKEIIEKEIPAKTIEELSIPFHICISNLSNGTAEYRNTGLLGNTVLASSSIPVLFSPLKIGDSLFVDGGLMDNIPVEPIKHDCEHIIVSNISPINTNTKLGNMLQIATRSFYMSVNQNLEKVKRQADYYIEPKNISKYEMFSRKHADELYDLGYKTTMKVFSEKKAIKE